MKLCRYFGEYGVDVFENERLKVNHPDDFNDPFESLIGSKHYEPSLDEYTERVHSKAFIEQYMERSRVSKEQALRDFSDNNIVSEYKKYLEHIKKPKTQDEIKLSRHSVRKEGARNVRMLCFSEIAKDNKYEDILMWSHYSKSHKGAKIVFETDLLGLQSKSLEKVTYSKSRPMFDYSAYYNVDEEAQKLCFSNVWKTKAEIWKYEKEWRWLIHKAECYPEFIEGKEHCFSTINLECIKEIYFGCQIDKSKRDAYAELIKEKCPYVKMFQSEVHEHKYELVYVPIS